MYTNILIEEGIEAFRVKLEKREDKTIPTEFMIKLLRLVLESNLFEFNKEFWLQLLGTAMGTRVAPTYANMFMNFLENSMLDDCPNHLRDLIFAWKRFIDDILLLFLGTYEQLEELYTYLNSYHATMKFDKPVFDNLWTLKSRLKATKLQQIYIEKKRTNQMPSCLALPTLDTSLLTSFTA